MYNQVLNTSSDRYSKISSDNLFKNSFCELKNSLHLIKISLVPACVDFFLFCCWELLRRICLCLLSVPSCGSCRQTRSLVTLVFSRLNRPSSLCPSTTHSWLPRCPPPLQYVQVFPKTGTSKLRTELKLSLQQGTLIASGQLVVHQDYQVVLFETAF